MVVLIRRYGCEILVGLGLLVTTLVVFRSACANGFVDFDDGLYVADNPYLAQGLTRDGIAWAFTTFHAGNWHPLTWLSYLIEYPLAGTDPRVYHRTNVLLHAANGLLLFWAWRYLTGAVWRSALVAALFALHPLHVESVAWVSERKDVLSTFFGLLALLAYAGYVRERRWGWYLLGVLAFALGLLAKPMLVTWPCVLLLLDYWPLRRQEPLGRLLGEKAPLFLLTAGCCVLTWYAQQQGHAVQSLERYSLGVRLGNAVVGYARYIGQMLWPAGLAAFYPHPAKHLLGGQLALALVLLGGVTLLAVRQRRRQPYLLLGWLWYLGTLVPVIGLVQVGDQAWADRYTYLPLIGLFVMLAWGLGDLAGHWAWRGFLISLASVVLILCALASVRQIGTWRDRITLWSHALDVTSDNWLAHTNLGAALQQQGQVPQAARHYLAAIQIAPARARPHLNLGMILVQQGKLAEATAELRQAVVLIPDYADAHLKLGLALQKQGQLAEAVAELRQAIALEPESAEAHNNLGLALRQQGQLKAAIAALRQAVALKPTLFEAHANLGSALHRQGELDEAVAELRQAVALKPNDAATHGQLGLALRDKGKFAEALYHLKQAQELGRGNPEWRERSARWLRECESLMELKKAVPEGK